jgi:hypothetical protein
MDDRQAALVAASTDMLRWIEREASMIAALADVATKEHDGHRHADLLADPTCHDLLERATKAAMAVEKTLPALREALDKLTNQQSAICVAMTVAAKVAHQQGAEATVTIRSEGVDYTCVMSTEQAKRINEAMEDQRKVRGATRSLADFIRGGDDE